MIDPEKPIADHSDAMLLPFDQDAIAAAVLHEKLIDAETPGYKVEFSPEEAERLGAFVEDALSAEDAAESSIDLLDALGEEPLERID